MNEYDKQRDIGAEGQRAAVYHAKRAPISERLRAVSGAKRWFTPDPLSHEAADTIDALVAALQNMVDADELTKDDYDQANAALALARKGG